VQVSGSFDHGIRMDASRVANSSWLRAILGAFVLAMRKQTLETFGANPFPLVFLDDPQVTFDPRNKRKWAEEIARIANENVASPEAMQLNRQEVPQASPERHEEFDVSRNPS
jgi:hypothetical protein